MIEPDAASEKLRMPIHAGAKKPMTFSVDGLRACAMYVRIVLLLFQPFNAGGGCYPAGGARVFRHRPFVTGR
jgi:hypothetical protein